MFKLIKPKFITPMLSATRYTIIILVFLGVVGILAKHFDLTINVTSSMPIGFYIRDAGGVGKGDIVLVCLKDPYRSIGIQKGYIAKGKRCSGANPVIKKVIAVPGDGVVLGMESIEVNKKSYPFKTLMKDSKGRALGIYPRGKYSQGYWLIGDNSSKSWDSRYFGPVEESQILTKLKPLLVGGY